MFLAPAPELVTREASRSGVFYTGICLSEVPSPARLECERRKRGSRAHRGDLLCVERRRKEEAPQPTPGGPPSPPCGSTERTSRAESRTRIEPQHSLRFGPSGSHECRPRVTGVERELKEQGVPGETCVPPGTPLDSDSPPGASARGEPRSEPTKSATFKCPREDSNLHGVYPHQALNLARLPFRHLGSEATVCPGGNGKPRRP